MSDAIEKRLQYTRDWKKRNKEKVSKYNAQYYLEHVHEIKERMSKYNTDYYLSRADLIKKRRRDRYYAEKTKQDGHNE